PYTVPFHPLTFRLPAISVHPYPPHLHPHSFPTRRSSDLALTLTVSKVTVLSAPGLCEVTASPARIGPLMFSVRLEPASSVQVVPDRKSTRLNSSHDQKSYADFGLIQIIPTSCTAVPPWLA